LRVCVYPASICLIESLSYRAAIVDDAAAAPARLFRHHRSNSIGGGIVKDSAPRSIDSLFEKVGRGEEEETGRKVKRPSRKTMKSALSRG